jgi:hypothetical protein
MYYGNQLQAALQALGVAEVMVSDNFASTFTVGAAGAAKAAVSIPLTPVSDTAVYDGQVLFFGSPTKIAIIDGDQAAGAATLTVKPLAVALVAADKAHPWESVGAIEGDISEGGGWDENMLTALQTGGIVHQATVTPQKLALTMPIIAGAAQFWRLCEPTGLPDGPPETDAPVKEKALFLVPRAAVGAGLSYEGSSWSPAAPANSLFFPRCYLSRGPIPRPRANGGKSIVTVTAVPMYYSAGPSGKRGWVRDDPVAKGYSTFRC